MDFLVPDEKKPKKAPAAKNVAAEDQLREEAKERLRQKGLNPTDLAGIIQSDAKVLRAWMNGKSCLGNVRVLVKVASWMKAKTFTKKCDVCQNRFKCTLTECRVVKAHAEPDWDAAE